MLLCVGTLAAQPVTFGIKAGARLTSDMDQYWATSESKQYVVGPMVVARLPRGFGLEFDVLYRHIGYRSSDSDILGGSYTQRVTGNSLEFPIVLRKTLGWGIYAGAGYAPRSTSGSGHENVIQVNGLDSRNTTFFQSDFPTEFRTTHGVVGAAGIEKRVGPVRLAPEVRYVRRTRPFVEIYGSRGFSIVSTQNQVDLFVGISFP